MTSLNPELLTTLDDGVGEVLSFLTGIDLEYQPEVDRYRVITRALNRALRANALEHEWSYYADTESIGTAVAGMRELWFDADIRPRGIGDDSVRLVDGNSVTQVWAYILPRDSLHKYIGRPGLWCSFTRNTVEFSRSFEEGWDGLDVMVPVMREPVMFRLPPEGDAVDQEILDQPIDFPYPDIITMRAAYYVAQSDPIMQPRAQTIEAQYKDLMYQVIERDDRVTDVPYLNEFFVPIKSGIMGGGESHPHPHADERR